jgi:hypothetical protein
VTSHLAVPAPREEVFARRDGGRHDDVVYDRVFESGEPVAAGWARRIVRGAALLRVVAADTRRWLWELSHPRGADTPGDVQP